MASINLSDLQLFSVVGRARSFRKAAVESGESASTLSDAVRRLEAQIGVRLLNRTTRSVTATEAGARLLARLDPMLREVVAAVDEVNSFRDTPVGTLRLNVPGVVAQVVLPPILATFMRAHPGIKVEVSAEDRFSDVFAAGFDAGVRYEEKLEKDVVAIPIGPRTQRFAAVAAPDYLAANGTPKHPRDLLKHACVAHRFASGAVLTWEFERKGESVKVIPTGPLLTDSGGLELSCARSGVGILYTFEEFVAPFLADGTLAPVLEEWWPRFSGPYLYYPSREHSPAPLRAFIEFLQRSHEPARSSRARRAS